MKSYLIAIVTLVIFSIPSLGAAATGRPGPYFSAFLGGSFARDVTVSGFDYFNGIPFSDEVSYDSGIYTGGTGGYDFGFMRLEGELAYRYNDIDTITFSNGSRFNSDEGYIGVFATMFNVFFDLHNSSPVTPYLGGGIGFASLYLSDTYGFGPNGYGQLYADSDDTVFASQVGAGVDIALNNRYSLDIGYRYFITEEANLDSFISTNKLKFESHNAMVGFKMKF
jgi:opacity protein-like surface antigen